MDLEFLSCIFTLDLERWLLIAGAIISDCEGVAPFALGAQASAISNVWDDDKVWCLVYWELCTLYQWIYADAPSILTCISLSQHAGLMIVEVLPKGIFLESNFSQWFRNTRQWRCLNEQFSIDWNTLSTPDDWSEYSHGMNADNSQDCWHPLWYTLASQRTDSTVQWH